MPSRAETQAGQLVQAAQEAGAFFHDGDVAYADVLATQPVPHHEVLRVRSRAFRTWLSGRHWQATGRPAGGQALTEAIDVIAAHGQFDGPNRRVGLRIAEHRGAIYLDLGDDRYGSSRSTRLAGASSTGRRSRSVAHGALRLFRFRAPVAQSKSCVPSST
jgi:hypothetical protein